MATFLNPKLWKKNEAYQIGEIVISEGEIWQSCLAVPAGKDLDAPYWTQINAEESGGDGGGGGGDAQTTDVYFWNTTDESEELSNVIPNAVKYISGFENGDTMAPIFTELSFEEDNFDDTFEGTTTTYHGIKISDMPVGAVIYLFFDNQYSLSGMTFIYTETENSVEGRNVGNTCPIPLDGNFINGSYAVVEGGIQ